MPTPVPFADDGGTPTWRARHASPPALRFPIWRFLFALAALPFLLAFMAAASWLAWMCFEGVMGPPAAYHHAGWHSGRLQPSYGGTLACRSAWRCASSPWWGPSEWCGLYSRCWPWRWWLGCDVARLLASGAFLARRESIG